ncbi:phosphoribosyl transferase [Candidatus Parcubacteria bacterium]|nr:MAG: phosphoribosyl transferase [Candidatus Parcubacteria bacterium]
MFADREEAGKRLAEQLLEHRGKDALVLALPRGGVVLGAVIARALSLPLDIIAVRKIGHPSAPEFALGAVDEEGTRILNEEEAALVDPDWLASETEQQMKEAKRRSRVYRSGKAHANMSGKTAIIVDDGVATGLTMRLAVKVAKAHMPKRVIVATPVSSSEAAEEILKDADELIVLEPPEEFLGAVGAHYIRFDQIEDAEVIRLMKQQ